MKDFKIELGPDVEIGIHDLLDDNLLVIAMRRSGKTMRLRSIAEQVGKHMPIYVFDHEGEFSSLREELQILICGDGGEVPARPETASTLARRLVEIGASAVLDISTLTRKDKRLFVMGFLQAMIDLPRRLWGPRLIVLDEIHEFCPQGGKDVDAQARETVNQLMALGGKRGLGVVAGTQRIAKLDKDSAAEFGNVCVGRTTLGADIAKACERLDFPRERGPQLKKLKKGEMYAAGTSFEFDEAKLFQGIMAKTTHPASAGQRRALKPPPPNEAILKYASELKDLQRVADAEKITQKSLAEENARLKSEVEQLRARRPLPVPDPSARSLPDGGDRTPQIDAKNIERQIANARQVANLEGRQEVLAILGDDLERLQVKTSNLSESYASSGHVLSDLLLDAKQVAARVDKARAKTGSDLERAAKSTPAPTPRVTERSHVGDGWSDPNLGQGKERSMLVALAQHPEGLDRKALGIIAGMSSASGTFATYLGKLRSNGWVSKGTPIAITDAGVAALGSYEPLPTGRDLLEYWLGWVNQGGERRLLEALVEAGPSGLSREELGRASGISHASGTFATYLGKLRRLDLVDKGSPIRLSRTLLEACE